MLRQAHASSGKMHPIFIKPLVPSNINHETGHIGLTILLVKNLFDMSAQAIRQNNVL